MARINCRQRHFLYLCFYSSEDRLWRVLPRKDEQIFHFFFSFFLLTKLTLLALTIVTNKGYRYGRETDKPKSRMCICVCMCLPEDQGFYIVYTQQLECSLEICKPRVYKQCIFQWWCCSLDKDYCLPWILCVGSLRPGSFPCRTLWKIVAYGSPIMNGSFMVFCYNDQ